MKEAKLLDRREFTLAAAMAVLSGVAVTIWGCGGGSSYSSSPVAPTTPAAGDKTGSVSDNHGHSAVITSAQLTAGGAINLDIRGSADHTHAVALAASDMSAIASGQRVSKPSTSEPGHSHTVTFN
jgi:hypothetical protein